jgi:hypothetical protein
VGRKGIIPPFDKEAADKENAEEVNSELQRGDNEHLDFVNYHQGLAVVEEEFEELKAEIFKKDANPYRIKAEAAQVAAMGRKMMRLADKHLYYQKYLTTEEGREKTRAIIG